MPCHGILDSDYSVISRRYSCQARLIGGRIGFHRKDVLNHRVRSIETSRSSAAWTFGIMTVSVIPCRYVASASPYMMDDCIFQTTATINHVRWRRKIYSPIVALVVE